MSRARTPTTTLVLPLRGLRPTARRTDPAVHRAAIGRISRCSAGYRAWCRTVKARAEGSHRPCESLVQYPREGGRRMAREVATLKTIETNIPARMDRLPWSALALDGGFRLGHGLVVGRLAVTIVGAI